MSNPVYLLIDLDTKGRSKARYGVLWWTVLSPAKTNLGPNLTFGFQRFASPFLFSPGFSDC